MSGWGEENPRKRFVATANLVHCEMPCECIKICSIQNMYMLIQIHANLMKNQYMPTIVHTKCNTI